jgi:Flp pilus assembly protein TadG
MSRHCRPAQPSLSNREAPSFPSVLRWRQPLKAARSCAALFMNHARNPRRARRRTSGTTLVEVAVVLPVFIILLFGLWAYGHAQMVSNMLKGAARNGARLGACEGVTTAHVKARVQEIMASAVDASKVTIQVKDASASDNGGAFPSTAAAMNGLTDLELSTANSRQLFVVRATCNYNSVAILPTSWFKNVQLHGESFMRHE